MGAGVQSAGVGVGVDQAAWDRGSFVLPLVLAGVAQIAMLLAPTGEGRATAIPAAEGSWP